MKRVAILQSNYIPWKGYFDMIAAVDEFILYDEMQYTKNDWRNRNQIKTPQGIMWLTIPVKVKGRFGQRICDTEVDGNRWLAQHRKTLEANYRKSLYFEEVSTLIDPLYNRTYETISDVNHAFIKAVCNYLGIHTKITCSSSYRMIEGKTERLVDLCQQAGAGEYISGPAAKSYIDEAVFEGAKIALRWFDYSGYPPYPQLWGDFCHGVSILDLLFNCGKSAPNYMRFVKND